MLEKVRGLPKKFPSDNAKTFKTAAKMTDSVLLKDEDVKSYLSGVEWLFNLEKAPWWGGVHQTMSQEADWAGKATSSCTWQLCTYPVLLWGMMGLVHV